MDVKIFTAIDTVTEPCRGIDFYPERISSTLRGVVMLEKIMRSHDDFHNQQSHRHPSLGLADGGNIVAVH